MMKKRNEHRRLKTIGWLMLASLLLLVAFSCSWLLAQYREEKQRLHADLEVVFNKTRDSILNAALDKEISVLLRDSVSVDGTRLKFQLSVNHKNFPAGASLPDFSPVNASQIQRITIVNKGDDSVPAIFMGKALRAAFTQTIDSRDRLYENFLSAIDSTKLETAFRRAVQRKNTRFGILKVYAPGKDSTFVFSTPEANSSALKINGYGLYLFKQILPQIGFSLFLLLLSGLTFLLAYRSIWRQHRFGKQKDNFISNISHELKTPVATTKVALEALSNYNALEDPKRSRQYLQIANAEMERLELLVSRVLNTIQTEHGALELDKEPVDLGSLIREITTALQPSMEEKNLQCSCIIPAENLMISADKMHLRGALYNLIDNAIKYGGPVLKVTVETREEVLLISVWDNGDGIPAVYHNSVFEKFFRVPQGNKHDVKGHGLGLSYARYVVEAHKGSIGLSSVSGQGTTFTILLPLSLML